MPMRVRLNKILWSCQAASQAALLDLRKRMLLIAKSIKCYHQADFHQVFKKQEQLMRGLPRSPTRGVTHLGSHADGGAGEEDVLITPRSQPCSLVRLS